MLTLMRALPSTGTSEPSGNTTLLAFSGCTTWMPTLSLLSLSNLSHLRAESDFKARVHAAYVGDPSFVDRDFIKDLVYKDGLWFAGQALLVPRLLT